ncbi:hypothetical protein A2U01_0107259, partial [Trifolium medium]|nr:hypothetical protein [Trifolium medium]
MHSSPPPLQLGHRERRCSGRIHGGR